MFYDFILVFYDFSVHFPGTKLPPVRPSAGNGFWAVWWEQRKKGGGEKKEGKKRRKEKGKKEKKKKKKRN